MSSEDVDLFRQIKHAFNHTSIITKYTFNNLKVRQINNHKVMSVALRAVGRLLERVRRELQAQQAQYDSLLRAMEDAPPAVL